MTEPDPVLSLRLIREIDTFEGEATPEELFALARRLVLDARAGAARARALAVTARQIQRERAQRDRAR
jgi:hypothetical protein